MSLAGARGTLPRITAADLPRIERRLRERPGVPVDEPGVRRAAVALVLRPDARGDLELLFIRRAVFEGDPWSGQVALPGGRQEPGDESLAHTAMRETFEETAIGLARDGRLLGVLDDLHPRTPVLPPIVVRPFVFAIDADVPLALSPEVALAFWVPVSAIHHPAASVESLVRVRGEERRVASFLHGEHVIWGMTHRILTGFLERLGA